MIIYVIIIITIIVIMLFDVCVHRIE